ncbi:MAG: replicative DNA helicase [Clostridiales bacterium]|nr:replicative DNA helicase [Clostridiales bacterium]
MTTDVSARKMPFSLEAEQSVLGSVLVDAEKLTEITGFLKSEDFYLDEHKEIYLAMQELFSVSRNIDIVTLIETLVKGGVYDRDQSMAYLKVIADTVPSASNVLDYAQIVKGKSTLRKLITACDETCDEAFLEADEVNMILDRAEQRIFDIADRENAKGFSHIREVLVNTYDHLKQIQADPTSAMGTPTGFAMVDQFLVGLGKGDLCIVGGRPGMGKSAFAISVALNVAKATKKKVCIFSLEMSNEQVVQRMLSSEALVDNYKMRSGRLDAKDWENLAHASAALAETDIYIDDSTAMTCASMKSKLRRMRDNLGLVIIDYIGLMHSERKIDNRAVEVGEISRNLKIMAKEMNVPVIVCAQLNRGTEGRSEKRPSISDLRDSGAIEQDADEVLMIYRGEYYDDGGENDNMAEIIIGKNRHGGTGTAKVGWYKDYAKFTSIDDKFSEY